jgi:hypothetical protein
MLVRAGDLDVPQAGVRNSPCTLGNAAAFTATVRESGLPNACYDST